MEHIHPGHILQQELLRRGRTQKDFAFLLGKKVSEVNELIKGKRNITVQRDILLSTLFDDPEKKRLHLQMEYDYTQAKQSIDVQRISDIRSRKKDVVDVQGDGKKEHLDEKEISENPVASPKESSIIDDAVPAEEKKNTPGNTTNDKRKEHEIFRNF